MNILLVCEEYPPAMHGGIGTFTKSLAEALVIKGNKVVVIGVYSTNLLRTYSEELESINGVVVCRLHGFPRLKLKRVRFVAERFLLARKIRQLHKLFNFDLLECHDSGGWLAFGKLPDIPKIIRLHGSQIYFNHELHRNTGKLNMIIEKKWINRSDYIISVSDYVAKKTLGLLGINKEYTVIYNAVDTRVFSPNINVQTENGLILFTGSIIPKKGVAELIKAFKILSPKFPDAHLLFVGKDLKRMPSGETYSQFLLRDLPDEVAKKIQFLGWYNNNKLPELLQKAEVCCFPSHAEAFAIAPLEAMSVGTPVVFMKTGSGPEEIEDGVSGLLCDTKNPYDIAEKIAAFLQYPVFAQTIGCNAITRVSNLFNVDNWIVQNINVYSTCISKYNSKQY